MSENLNLIGKKLEHLARMRAYEHDPEILFQFFNNLVRHVPVLQGIHDRLKMFVERTYGSSLITE